MVDMPAPNPQRIVLPPHRERARRPRIVRLREWARRNLFNSRWGTLLTLVTTAVGALLLYGIIYFVFVDANWRVITDNRWLLFAGGFPMDQEWRLWFSVSFVFLLIGMTYGTWASLGRRDHLFIVLVSGFAILLLAHGGAALWSTLWYLIAIGLLYVGYAITIRMPREAGPRRTLQQRIVTGLLMAALPIVLIVLLASEGRVRASSMASC